MTLVLACTEFDSTAGTCVTESWIEQPGLLPPLSAAEGSIVATAMVTACATAWAFKFLRRFIWAKA